VQEYLVYTDGSCSARDRVGGYAFKVISERGEFTDGAYEYNTTISRMELKAVISALEYIQGEPDAVILVISDSEYVVKGFMDKTRKRNANCDLWDYLEELARQFAHVELEHTYGHVGTPDNEEVDKMAGAFRHQALMLEKMMI